MQETLNQIHHGDCIRLMDRLPAKAWIWRLRIPVRFRPRFLGVGLLIRRLLGHVDGRVFR